MLSVSLTMVVRSAQLYMNVNTYKKAYFFLHSNPKYYRLFGNEREFKNGRCRTISGHFFANCINIFHKTEVQTVILMCLMGQNLNWFKSYDIKWSLRLWACLANSEIDHQNLQLINGHSRPFLAIFLPTIWKSFTKLWFRRSFFGAYWD